MASTSRIKYNRSSLQSAVEAASKAAAGFRSARFVYATYLGFVIDRSAPLMQSYVRVEADGSARKIEYNPMEACA